MKGLLAQENEEIKSEIITDTLVYYYAAGKRLDNETGERMYEQYMSNPEETENFILKVPVYISRNAMREGRVNSGNNTIFLLPGGAFNSSDKSNYSNADQCTAGLPTLLAANFTTVLIDYQFVADNSLSLILFQGCSPNLVATNTKIKQLKASFICFWSLRDIIIDLVNNAATYNIDPDNMMMTGESAGGYLTLMYMFMEKNEIPSTIGTGSFCSSNWPSSLFGITTWGNICSIPPFLINDFWLTGTYRLPRMKGYMPMNSGGLFNHFFNEDNFVTSYPSYLNLLHGTCDEFIFQGYGRLPYKCVRTSPSPYIFNYSTDNNKFNFSYGSAWVYNAVKDFVPSRFDQVCGGGHKPHSSTINRPYSTPQSNSADVYSGTWNVCDLDNPTSSNSTTHRLKVWIENFANEVFNNSFTGGISTLTPELPTQGCLNDLNVSTITNINVAGVGGGGFTATTVGGAGASVYEWEFIGCYNGIGSGTYTNTSFLNTITIPPFAASICKLTVNVTAKNGCGGNKTFTRVINYSTPCNNCNGGSSSKISIENDIDNIG